jgi:hypothetical protein
VARPFRLLPRLIAAVLLLQVVLAPAQCLAMAAVPAGLDAVVCSPEGARTIHIGPDGQEMPAQDAAAGVCAVCAALPQAALPNPPAPPAPAWVPRPAPWHPGVQDANGPPARGPPFGSRAPPAFG